jgi:hypothetical protein
MPKSIVKQLKLPKLGQIGYVVKDVEYCIVLQGYVWHTALDAAG